MKAFGRAAVLALSVSSAAGAQQQDPDLSAGGLAPPEAIESESDQAAKQRETEAALEEAEKEDAGRGLEFFWLNGEIGVAHLGLQTFSSSELVDAGVVETTQTGLTYGGGLGLRLVFLTLGARFRMASFADYDLWTLNGEAGMRIPLGSIEPYFTFGAGYASLGGFGESGAALAETSANFQGFDVRGGVGLDVYLTEVFSIGGHLTGEVLFLTRSAVAAGDITNAGGELSPEVYAESGSSIGGTAALTLVAGLHF